MAPVYRAAVARGHETLLLHTGQHYSGSMSGQFFGELELPDPDRDLGVGSGSHPTQLAAILAAAEPVLADWRPDAVLVEGDTNSVLGVALAARTMGLRVGHVEAGLRSRDLSMPEELNRTLVDHLAADLFAPTPGAVDNLAAEGVTSGVRMTGNPIVDELERQRPAAQATGAAMQFGLEPQSLCAGHGAPRGEHRGPCSPPWHRRRHRAGRRDARHAGAGRVAPADRRSTSNVTASRSVRPSASCPPSAITSSSASRSPRPSS